MKDSMWAASIHNHFVELEKEWIDAYVNAAVETYEDLVSIAQRGKKSLLDKEKETLGNGVNDLLNYLVAYHVGYSGEPMQDQYRGSNLDLRELHETPGRYARDLGGLLDCSFGKQPLFSNLHGDFNPSTSIELTPSRCRTLTVNALSYLNERFTLARERVRVPLEDLYRDKLFFDATSVSDPRSYGYQLSLEDAVGRGWSIPEISRLASCFIEKINDWTYGNTLFTFEFASGRTLVIPSKAARSFIDVDAKRIKGIEMETGKSYASIGTSLGLFD